MHRMPAFESAGLAASWTGVYDVTPDWNPVLGPVDGVPGLHLAYGFSGHGFLQAPAIGEVVRDLFLRRVPPIDVSPFDATRFARGTLRPEVAIV